MKILVVDDDKEIAQLLEIYIRNEGYEPVSAYSGQEALTRLRTESDIGLMILDIMMPGMNGIEVVKEVRKDSQIPIIILSAKTEDMDKIQGLISGADDYVTKPFNPLEVMARVKSLLRRTEEHVTNDTPDVLDIGPLTINKDSHEVKTIRSFQLTKFLSGFGDRRALSRPKPSWSMSAICVTKLKKPLTVRKSFKLFGVSAIRSSPIRPNQF